MPRDARLTRRRILEAAYKEFRRRGFARVNVDEIAAAARVTKRTLYAHFRSKDELLAAAFEAQIDLATTAKRDLVDYTTGVTPAQMADSFFRELDAWCSKPRWSGSGFTRVAMELADLPGHPARVLARRHKSILETHLTERLQGAGVTAAAERAQEISILLEGAMALILIHGDRSYAAAAANAARRLLDVPPAKPRQQRRTRGRRAV
jgi:AcrR family transcriptional regulator